MEDVCKGIAVERVPPGSSIDSLDPPEPGGEQIQPSGLTSLTQKLERACLIDREARLSS